MKKVVLFMLGMSLGALVVIGLYALAGDKETLMRVATFVAGIVMVVSGAMAADPELD